MQHLASACLLWHLLGSPCASTHCGPSAEKAVLTLLSAPAQIDATKLLALLLEAPDARQAAAEHVGSLTEQFFAIASTYLTMVLARPGLSSDTDLSRL